MMFLSIFRQRSHRVYRCEGIANDVVYICFLDVEEVRWQSSRAGALAVLLRRRAGREAEQVRWQCS